MRKRSSILGFATVVIIVAAVVILFAYVAGWLSPGSLTPARFVDRFEQVDGVYCGFRRNHAKGLCFNGWFDSNGQGAALSKATVFQQGRVPVIGRFSLGGGYPYAADKPDTVRGLGICFMPAHGEEWRTAMVNLPIFPFPTPEAFYDQMLALAPDPATGKPDPARAQAFFAKYPESAKAFKLIQSKPISSGFENSTFSSLNAFRFINADGKTAWVRWSMVPVQPFAPVSPAHPETDLNYLFDALIANVHQQPLQWHLIITIAQPGDPRNDATLPWPLDRRQVDVGTLTINQVQSDDTSPARDINFDPLVLPYGIAPSDDPLLSPRSVVYMRSFTLREGECKSASAISTAETEEMK
ncbi:MAG: catalase family peroxidase [Rhabdochlamydiaceae bacterium]